MANYETLIASIKDAIKNNNKQAITGQVLQDAMLDMVSQLGKNYAFGGVATPSTNPGTPTTNTFYIATEAGTYTNMGGVVLNASGLYAIIWDGERWLSTRVADNVTAEEVVQIIEDNTLSALDKTSNKPVDSRGIASAIEAATEGNLPPLTTRVGLLEQGNLSNAGNYVAQSNRVSTVNYIFGQQTLSMPEGYQINTVTYFDEISLAVEEQIIIQKQTATIGRDGSVYKLVFRKADNSDFTPDEIRGYSHFTEIDGVIKYLRTNDAWIDIDLQLWRGSFNATTATDVVGYMGKYKSAFIKANGAIRLRLIVAGETRVVFYDKDYKMLSSTTYKTSTDVAVPTNCAIFRLDTLDRDIELYCQCGNKMNIPTMIKCPKRTDYTSFSFEFNLPKNASSDVTSTEEQEPVRYSGKTLAGHGVIRLPESYKEEGRPTRLIIFAHGSGDPFPASSQWGDYNKYVDYLAKEGYAIADCAAWGTELTDANSWYGSQFWGVPHNYACYQAMYRYLIDNYNLRQDGVFLFGKSQGGLQAYGLPLFTSIPILATCSLAGVYSPFMHIFGFDTKDRFACFRDLGFDGLEMDSDGNYIGAASVMVYGSGATLEEQYAYLRSQSAKMKGIVAFLHHSNWELDEHIDNSLTLGEVDGYRRYSDIPTIAFVAKDDPQKVYYHNLNAIKALQAGNSQAYIRLMPSGNSDPHHAVDTTAPKMTVTTALGETVSEVPIPWVEMLSFFRQFE